MPWIYPRTNYDQRVEFYQDIESLITPGFLTHTVNVNHNQLVLRSLYPSDIFLIRHRINQRSTEPEWKSWWIASCVWMVNGINLLEEKHTVPTLQKTILALPITILDQLYNIVLGLINRNHKALEGIEAYSYEPYSRLQWKQMGRNLPSRSFHVGIPGVEKMGLNSLQKIWVAFNLMEDERDNDRVTWESAKLIASSNAPKGVEKINSHDQKMVEETQTKRSDLLDFWFYQNLGLLTQKDWDSFEKRERIQHAKTVEELEDEMRRWVAGEDDEHDKIVRDYKEGILNQMEQEARKRATNWEVVRQESEHQEYIPPVPMVGYTLDQIQNLRQAPDSPFKVKQVFEDVSHKQQQIYDKYLSAREESDHLSIEGGKVTVREDLQTQIENRKVSMDDDHG